MSNILFSVSKVLSTDVITQATSIGELSRFSVVGRGGQAPYFWTVTPPSGAGTLQESTDGPMLSVDFIPTVAGVLVFTVRITDARRVSKTRQVSVSVVDPFAALVIATEDGDYIGLDGLGEGVLLGLDAALAPPAP